MLELRALSPTDGWAIVAQGDEIYLVRPPYRLTHRERLAAEKIPAVIKHLDLWAKEGLFFAGWRELIEFLRREIERNSDPGDFEEMAAASRLILEKASAEDLQRHLERLEDRLERGDRRGTLRGITVLLGLDKIRTDADMHRRCLAVLGRCHEMEDRRNQVPELWEASGVLRDWLRNIPDAYENVVGNWATELAERRQILAPA